MSARKSSHRTIFLIVSSGSPLALIASSLRSTSKKPVCPMTRSLHPPMAHCGQRVRFVATWREEFFEVPNGDYVASYMAEDPVIVQRGRDGKIRVYLNRCRHRGNLLCVHDRGNTRSFVCSYHAWTYTDGHLTGVPRSRDFYRGEIDHSKLGLIEAKVQVYGGLIFACWDANVMSLDDYLGDARWWLDHFLLREELGGLEVLPGQQRYIVPVNWKLPAENFGGDYFHFAATHGSVVSALAETDDKRIAATGATTAKS